MGLDWSALGLGVSERFVDAFLSFFFHAECEISSFAARAYSPPACAASLQEQKQQSSPPQTEASKTEFEESPLY